MPVGKWYGGGNDLSILCGVSPDSTQSTGGSQRLVLPSHKKKHSLFLRGFSRAEGLSKHYTNFRQRLRCILQPGYSNLEVSETHTSGACAFTPSGGPRVVTLHNFWERLGRRVTAFFVSSGWGWCLLHLRAAAWSWLAICINSMQGIP